MKCSLGISSFLEEISNLSHSVVFLYLFAFSLKKAFLSLLAILWNSAFIGNIFPFLLCLSLLFFSQLFVRPAQTTSLPSCISFSSLLLPSLLFSAICKACSHSHFAFFFHFLFLGICLITASYTMLWTSVHSSSGILSIRSNPLNLLVTSTVKS